MNMHETILAVQEALGPLFERGTRIDVSFTPTLKPRIHLFGVGPKDRETFEFVRRAFRVPKMKRTVFGDSAWWEGESEELELVIFDYLGPRCHIVEEKRTLPAKPKRTVTVRRIVCDDQADYVGGANGRKDYAASYETV